jgi:hypothetical protein
MKIKIKSCFWKCAGVLIKYWHDQIFVLTLRFLKVGSPQISFPNPQIRFANSRICAGIFLDVRTFRKCKNLRICGLNILLRFADLRFADPTNFFCPSNLRWLYGCFTWHLGLTYSYVGKENTSEANHFRSESETFRLCKFAELRFADWETKEILRICDLRIIHYKFAGWHTSEICRFAIVEWAQEFADFWFADEQKKLLAHLEFLQCHPS